MSAQQDNKLQKNNTEEGAVTFEGLLGDLENIVRKLEGDNLTLEDSLKEYEAGVKVVRIAQQRLDKMESRIEELSYDEVTKTELPK